GRVRSREVAYSPHASAAVRGDRGLAPARRPNSCGSACLNAGATGAFPWVAAGAHRRTLMFRAHQKIANYREWRDAARQLLRQRVRPYEVIWTTASDPQTLLFDPEPSGPSPHEGGTITIPRAFFALAEPVSRHSSERRWELLYRAAWRITNSQ